MQMKCFNHVLDGDLVGRTICSANVTLSFESVRKMLHDLESKSVITR